MSEHIINVVRATMLRCDITQSAPGEVNVRTTAECYFIVTPLRLGLSIL